MSKPTTAGKGESNQMIVVSAKPTPEEIAALKAKESLKEVKLHGVKVSAYDDLNKRDVEAYYIVRKPTAKILLDMADKGQKESLSAGSELQMKFCILHGDRDCLTNPNYGQDLYLGLLEEINKLSGQKKTELFEV